MLSGGCFCGNLRYQIEEAPEGSSYRVANCHCSMCRRISAAPFVTWIVVPTSGFKLVQGTAKALNSSPDALRQFCGECGSHISFAIAERPGELDITTCSLDNPGDFAPDVGIHRRSKLHWLGATEPADSGTASKT